MKLLQLPLLCTLIVSTVLTPVAGQQKRRNPDKVPAKSPAAPAPAPPTFENLLAADDFKVYVEVRNVGQLIKSSATNDVLEPILKLGGPPKDFTDFVEWLKLHAEQITTSRMLIGAWPSRPDVPEFVAAIEFSSAEEAAKFEKPLNGVLPTMFPPRPQSSPETEKKSAPSQPPTDQKLAEQKPAEQKPAAPEASYALQRAGSLLIVSPAPVQLKKLRPTGSKPLAEDSNFRIAYNRFASEPLFLFIDFKAVAKEREEREKQWEEERKKAAEASQERKEKEKEEEEDPDSTPGSKITVDETVAPGTLTATLAQPALPAQMDETKEPSSVQLASEALSTIGSSLFSSPPEIPDALGLGFSPDNDSFDFRALMIDAAGKTSDPIPFFSWVKFGSPIAPRSPSVIPADSELVLTMSLDLQQFYARMSTPSPSMVLRDTAGEQIPLQSTTPTATLEKALKIKIKDDLLPLLGSEIAVSLPLAEYNPFAPARSGQTLPVKDDGERESTANERAPFVVISLRDKEGMRKLLPKLIEGFPGHAVASLAQTERREDTELVSYANMFAYAFVGDFLVLSGEAATTRHVVDSYLKGATLAADAQFRNYTRWQPHELQGQVYVSSAFIESYKSWANSPNARISEEARMFFAHLTATAPPITYALSNDGLGTLHELHIPKNVLLLAIGAVAASENPPKTMANERTAMSALWTISYTETMYKQKNATFGSLEELIAADMLNKDVLENPNYKFELTITADGYSVSAVPTEYGKTGKLSFFLDQTGELRAADHAGAPAGASDPKITY
jgi:hypothetical protein